VSPNATQRTVVGGMAYGTQIMDKAGLGTRAFQQSLMDAAVMVLQRSDRAISNIFTLLVTFQQPAPPHAGAAGAGAGAAGGDGGGEAGATEAQDRARLLLAVKHMSGGERGGVSGGWGCVCGGGGCSGGG
jgi:hypothetical protein